MPRSVVPWILKDICSDQAYFGLNQSKMKSLAQLCSACVLLSQWNYIFPYSKDLKLMSSLKLNFLSCHVFQRCRKGTFSIFKKLMSSLKLNFLSCHVFQRCRKGTFSRRKSSINFKSGLLVKLSVQTVWIYYQQAVFLNHFVRQISNTRFFPFSSTLDVAHFFHCRLELGWFFQWSRKTLCLD